MIAMYPLVSLQMLIFSPLAVPNFPWDMESLRMEIGGLAAFGRNPDERISGIRCGESDRRYTQPIISV